MHTGIAFAIGALVGIALGAQRALAGSPRLRNAVSTTRPQPIGT